MPEHLALEERPRYPAEIHHHERIVATARIGMYSPCYQLLAGAVLTENQHRGIG